MKLEQFAGVNAGYVFELYERYRQNPDSVDAATRQAVAQYWAETPAILRLVVLHELEAVSHADSLFTIAQGTLRHTRERKGPTWAETCCTLCCS